MSVFAFDENVRRQIRKVVDYAKVNINQVDDILDMMNNQIAVPGERTDHLVLVPVGRWICYFLVDHPNKGRCHYFQISPDARGKLSDKPEMDYILKEFGIKSSLLDEHITIDEKGTEIKIILPFKNKN